MRVPSTREKQEAVIGTEMHSFPLNFARRIGLSLGAGRLRRAQSSRAPALRKPPSSASGAAGHRLLRARLLLAALACLLFPAAIFADSTTLDGQVVTLPPGFAIEVVARPPLVNRPVTGALDEEGRLYVSDSSRSNDDAREQIHARPCH